MRITLFGATGRTGRLLLEQAMAAGHTVVALVRDVSKLPIRNPALTVIEGDTLDAAAVDRVVLGTDAVVSTLGHASRKAGKAVSLAMATVVKSMEKLRVKRIVSVSTAGILGELRGLQRIVSSTLLRGPTADHRRQFDVLRSSGLDWTLVRPMRLTDGPKTGSYRVEAEGIPAGGTEVSRADVADFILKCLSGGGYVKSSPGLAY